MDFEPAPSDSLHADPVTVEVMALRPEVREDLRITRQVNSGQASFLIEDPASGRFSRVGVAEYTFVSLLDGRTTVAEALAFTATKHGLDALDEADAVSLAGWLVESGLALTRASRSGQRMAESQRNRRERERAGAMNPMFQKLPLGSPEFLVGPLVALLRFLFRFTATQSIALVAALAWLAVTGLLVVGNGESIWEASRNVFARDNWFWLLTTWLMVKGIHELGHAIACRLLGGRIGQAGVMFVLFMPLPYVEVSSSWMFQNKWHRILVAAAGMIVEAFLASVAFWVWVNTADPLIQMHARNLIVTATITTVLFNLNPLMRFDGYYMLSDYLELPNLSTNASRWLSYMRQKHWLGATVARPTWPEGKVPIVAVYAVAAFVWRMVICVSLAIAAMSMFWGAGVLLAIGAVAFWIGRPLSHLFANWKDPVRMNRKRFAAVTGVMAVAAVLVLATPYRRRVTAPVVVQHREPTDVRSISRGFVTQVLVQPGDQVQIGDVLARLTDKELEIDLQRLAAEIEQSRHRQRGFRQEQSLVELEIEQAAENALLARHRDLQRRRRGLVIRSEVSGTIIHSDLVDRLETLVTAGERLFIVADPRRIKLVAMIGQDDAVTLRQRNQFAADVWMEGQGCITDSIEFDRLKPRATRDLSHPAFASSLGGSLPVYSNPQAKSVDQQWKLVDPRVVAEAILPSGFSALRSGQRGTVRFMLDRRALGEIWLDDCYQWYRKSTAEANHS